MKTEQDRRMLLAVVLSMGIVLLWTTFFAPEPPPPEEAGAEAPADGTDPATSGGAPVDPVPLAAVESVTQPKGVRTAYHAVAVAGDGFRAEVSSTSGTVRNLELPAFHASKTVTPLHSWVIGKVTGDSAATWEPYAGGETPHQVFTEVGGLLLAGAGAIDDDGGIAAEDGHLVDLRTGQEGEATGAYTVQKSGDTITASRTRSDGLVITKTYGPGDAPHTMQVSVTFQNAGGVPLKPWIGVVDKMTGESGRFSNGTRPVLFTDGSVEHQDDLADMDGPGKVEWDGDLAWFGVGNRYFFGVLVPDAPLVAANVITDDTPGGRYGTFLQTEALAPGDTRTHTFMAYVGPKDLDALKALGHDLEDAVEYGWFGFFSKILLFVLKLFQRGVVNWGAAIILLTLFVKLLFFPLTQKSFESSRRMQALQPKLNALKEKYKDNKELQTQETMKLFQEHKVNPMGGCLPTLIQFPVWIALYNVMLYSVELYDTSFLYLQDLTEADPYGVVPTIYAVLMIVQQRMMPMSPTMDETQQKMLKAMPLIFAFFMFSFPSGLVMYFCVNMMLTIIQQWFIRRKFPDVPANAPAAT